MKSTQKTRSFPTREKAPLGLKVICVILALAAFSPLFITPSNADSDPLNLGSRFTGRTGGSSSGGGGSGDVAGPASSTDNAAVRFDGTTGKAIQNSGVIIDDSNNVSGVGTISTGAATVTSNSANSLAVGPNGTTNPVLTVISNTASQASGVSVTGNATGVAPTIVPTDSGANVGMTLNTKGTGSLTLQTAGAGNIVVNSTSGNVQLNQGGNNKVIVTSNQTTIANGGSNTAATTPIIITPASGSSTSAGTEALSIDIGSGGTRTWASNTSISSQRFIRIQRPTAAFSSATGTITDAYTLAIDNAPAAGTNAAITNPYALGVIAGNSYFGGKHVFDSTITPAATTGDRTINKPTGTVNIAAAGTTVTVTNSLVTTSSIVMAVLRTNDSTAAIKNVVPGAGSFVINLTAAATAEVSIGFMVIN